MQTGLSNALRIKHIFICISLSFISSFSVVFVFYLFLMDTALLDLNTCLGLLEGRVCYFGRNNIWSDSSYLQTITGFYSAIITVLIGMVAIVATVGAYTIRSSVRAQAEQELPQIVANHFKHVDGQIFIRGLIDEKMADKVKELNESLKSLPIPESGTLFAQLNSIERRLESLEELQETGETAE